MPKRIQLTLFVSPPDSLAIEQVRHQFNPEQHRLIAAHVTLCREDELEPLSAVVANLEHLAAPPLVLDFGPAERFDAGKGVLLPAAGGLDDFWQLRRQVLQGVVEQPRLHEPHLTLMHPRNSTCTDDTFVQIQRHALPRRVVFNSICLIKQEVGQPWEVLRTFPLKGVSEAS